MSGVTSELLKRTTLQGKNTYNMISIMPEYLYFFEVLLKNSVNNFIMTFVTLANVL